MHSTASTLVKLFTYFPVSTQFEFVTFVYELSLNNQDNCSTTLNKIMFELVTYLFLFRLQ